MGTYWTPCPLGRLDVTLGTPTWPATWTTGSYYLKNKCGACVLQLLCPPQRVCTGSLSPGCGHGWPDPLSRSPGSAYPRVLASGSPLLTQETWGAKKGSASLCPLARQSVLQRDSSRVCAEEVRIPMADFGCVAAGSLPQFPHLSAGRGNTGKPAQGLQEQRLHECFASGALLAGGPLCHSVRTDVGGLLGRCEDLSPLCFRHGSQRGCGRD